MEMIKPVHCHLFEEVTGPVHYVPKTDPYSLSSGIFVSLDYNSRFPYNGQRQRQNPLSGNLVQADVQISSMLRHSFTEKAKHFPAAVQEQLLFIFSFYGFTKTELSKIMHVSRPSVYAWIEGTEPEREKQEKIKRIAQTAFDIDTNPDYPLFHEFVNKPVLNYKKSLIDILSSKKKIAGSFPELVRNIYHLTKERRKRLQSPAKSGHTDNNSILDYNMDSIIGKE